MLEFKPLSEDDCPRLRTILTNAPDRGCEYTLGNLFIWRKHYATTMASCHEAALIRFEKDAHAYLFPVGTGCDIKNVIDELVEENRKNKEKFRIIAARKEDCDLLESLFPDKFKYHLTRDYAEYVYNTEDLAELVGKKFHSKRNFISRFTAEHPDYEFCEITRENLAQVCEMNNLWYEENLTSDNDGLAEERIAASVALESMFDIGLVGGFIKSKDRILAYSIGEPINENTFCVHIEKAFHEIIGAYAIINRDFVRHFCKDYMYVNREDDVGDEGLRRAKLSYNPAIITEKYVVEEK